ncbi:cytochrome P450 [Wolfiporia cocos MD-104 SS10]|uniref:Cytochrome P450 n=1 Tax=Wolfiporia cocos (strain MD-104) TaxID=742152 RepID=A0A2H3JND1_WOLCO|nr:cytochrome P450 [Wolfiporia cocos MD-104 SS10]
MSQLTLTLTLLSLGVAVFLVWTAIRILVAPLVSPLRDLPGPPRDNWLYGHIRQFNQNEDAATLQQSWAETYGPTLRMKGWMNSDRLFTIDTRALNHILSHSHDYPKPPGADLHLGSVLGRGRFFSIQGEQHRKQNPAFGPAQIRELTGIFIEKAIQLRDIWSLELERNGDGAPARFDVLSWLSKMTLDVIGLAGFNYYFDTLNVAGEPNELSQAFDVMFASIIGVGGSILRMLKMHISLLRFIPDAAARQAAAAQSVMRRIGMQLITEKRAAVIEAAQMGEKKSGKLHGRDLLTLLIKANMSVDIPESQRLSDEEVLARCRFLVAGHETTSNATAWCLYSLAVYPSIQHKLREELLSVATDDPSMDELNALPYLDAVIRETMRVHSPVAAAVRIASKDDVIPLNTPYTDVRGAVHDFVRVKKGTVIVVPILAINGSKAMWGEDAAAFRPERWETLPETVHSIPGVWGNMLSFLGGPRACIGYRFSLVEMKALIFTLLRAFEFELAVPTSEVTKKTGIVQRPYIRCEMEKGSQLPLLIKPYQQE